MPSLDFVSPARTQFSFPSPSISRAGSEFSVRTTGPKHQTPLYSVIDGNSALAHVAYGLTDVALVYPTVSDDAMSESLSKLSTDPNCFGDMCQVTEVDTKTGAGCAALGSLSTGALSTVFASSQSLTQMLPSLHKLTKERSPVVFHVATSGVDADLKQFPDYSDVFRVVHSGFGILHSNSVQECHDMALVAHLVSARVALPFMHFYDGTRTAHEVVKAQLVPYSKLNKICEHLKNNYFRADVASKKKIPDIVDDVMTQMRRVFKRRYRVFEYSGSASAEHVIISLCSQAETAALSYAVGSAASKGQRVGLLQVRMLRPWSTRLLLQSLPLGTMKRCVVVVGAQQDASASNVLYSDVVASVPLGHGVQVCSSSFSEAIDAASAQSLLTQLSASTPVESQIVVEPAVRAKAPALRSDIKKVITWDKAGEGGNPILELAQILGESSSTCVHAMQTQDAYALGGMVVSTNMHLSNVSFAAPALSSATAKADYVAVNDTKLLDLFDVTARLKNGGVLMLNSNAKTQDELESQLPAALRKDLALRKIKLYALDAASFEEDAGLAFQLGLLMLNDIIDRPSLGEAAEYIKSALAFPLAHHHQLSLKHVGELVGKVAANLAPVSVAEAWIAEVIPVSEAKEGEEAPPARVLPTSIEKSSFVRKSAPFREPEPVGVTQWHKAALRLMFPGEYGTQDVHRPQDGEKEKSFVVKVGKNIRLTPGDYDRNVFHIEFDLAGTGLKYGVGDALGIFARNRKCDVDAFIEMYGLTADDSVTIRNADGREEVRSVNQVCTQLLDLFGRPSRRFYEKLAPFAAEAKERTKLEYLAGKEGGFEFKKRVEATVTFADILKEFSSARPSLAELCELVSPIKPRHYSIASAQSMHPDSVHLLIVLVEWATPSGEKRFGQCTKYLVDLPEGSDVSVCVKPSVMTLPEDPMAPVVMAGLGTGMAPFRAFIQERAMQAASGMKVGPMSLYFGSRSMFKEYLYGDELEAYNTSGLLTNLRCAFSRDGPKKVYIQMLISEDARQLHEYLDGTTGQFYLCGPTWPAGDVQDAITGAFEDYGGYSPEDAAKAIAEMKEHERYILEVY